MGAPTPPAVDLTTSDTRETILTLVNECVDYIADSIEYWLKELASFASSHASEIGGLLGLLGGGIVGGIVGWAIGDQIEDKFEQFCKDTWDEFEKFLEDLRTTIGGFFGDPLLISQIASNYRDASRALGPNDGETIATVNTYLKAKWTGEGFNNFIVLSEKQHKALVSMQTMMQKSADLLDDNCTNLLKFWSTPPRASSDSARSSFRATPSSATRATGSRSVSASSPRPSPAASRRSRASCRRGPTTG